DAERRLLALAEALERPLQRRQDLTRSVQILDRALRGARLDDLAARDFDEVVEQHDPAHLHAHRPKHGHRAGAVKGAPELDQAGPAAAGRWPAKSVRAATNASAPPRKSAAAGETCSHTSPARIEARRRPMPVMRL